MHVCVLLVILSFLLCHLLRHISPLFRPPSLELLQSPAGLRKKRWVSWFTPTLLSSALYVVFTQLSSQDWVLDLLGSQTRIWYPRRIVLNVMLHSRSNISWWNVHSCRWKYQSISLLLRSKTSLNMSIHLLLSTLWKIFTFMIVYSFMFFRCQCDFHVLHCSCVLLIFIIPSWFYPFLLIAVFFFLILLLTFDGTQ